MRDNATHDAYNGATDFKPDSNDKAKSYPLTYNEASSLVSDAGRDIAYIRYDYNNNPVLIVFKDGHETEYIYSATGEKLRVIYTTAKPHVITREIGKDITERLPENYRVSTPETVDYLLGGALTLRNGVIDKYQFEEGYCQATPMYDNNKNQIAESFTFCYYDQDHLGNIRQVTMDDGSSKGEIIQTMDYYPFGAEFCDGGTKSYVQNHKYNGKELDLMHGLNTYDYGARQHDPILCRWDRMDPLSHKYYSTSPYAYCLNNPVRFIDPDGAKVIPVRITGEGQEKKYTYYRSNETFRNAMIAFGKTTFGHQMLADFTPKGSTMFGVKGNGKYADFKLIIQELDYDNPQDIAADLTGVDAYTNLYEENGTPYFKITINVQRPEGALAETINHESALHLSDYAEVLEAYKKGGYSKAKKVHNKTSQDEEHKDIEKKNPQFKGSIIYYNTLQEYLEDHPEYKNAFESAARGYNGVY